MTIKATLMIHNVKDIMLCQFLLLKNIYASYRKSNIHHTIKGTLLSFWLVVQMFFNVLWGKNCIQLIRLSWLCFCTKPNVNLTVYTKTLQGGFKTLSLTRVETLQISVTVFVFTLCFSSLFVGVCRFTALHTLFLQVLWGEFLPHGSKENTSVLHLYWLFTVGNQIQDRLIYNDVNTTVGQGAVNCIDPTQGNRRSVVCVRVCTLNLVFCIDGLISCLLSSLGTKLTAPYFHIHPIPSNILHLAVRWYIAELELQHLQPCWTPRCLEARRDWKMNVNLMKNTSKVQIES